MFLQPLALVALAAAAIPALLHLLERRDPPELEFPALRYLADAERRSARRLKLRHLLLLLLRTALIVVVVLAAARPLVPVRGGGTHEPTALVVVLDNSPSSGAVGGGGRPLLDRLREAARRSLERATAADRVWLLLADGALRAGSGEELLTVVERVTADARRMNLREAVERAALRADAEPLGTREVHVLSDLQRTAVAESAGAPANIPRGVRVLVLAPDRGRPANRGITAATVLDGTLRLAAGGTPHAPAAGVTARLNTRGEPEIGRALLGPGTEAVMALPAERPGWYWGEAELEPDELRADDRRVFVWRVAPPASAAADSSAGPFVQAAIEVLRSGGRAVDGSQRVVSSRAAAPAGIGTWIVLPPDDPALLGQLNRALATRGTTWRFAAEGTPGFATGPDLGLERVTVSRRVRLVRQRHPADTSRPEILATVNDEPWIVRDGGGGTVLVGSRLDTSWTSLPATPRFIPFMDALINRVAAGTSGQDVTHVEGPVGVQFDVRGSDTTGARVAGPDPRESDLSAASDDFVAERLQAAVLRDEAFDRELFAATRRADITAVLLTVAMIIATVELVIATRAR